MEVKREDAEGATMEQDEGDSLEDHPPALERGTLAGISTIPNPHQAIGTTNNHEDQEVREGLPPRRPLHRLHRNNFHNLVHNYGVENTPHTHIPPIGIYPVQVKVMLGKVLGGLKISIFSRKFSRM